MARVVLYNESYIKARTILLETGCWQWQNAIDSDGYGKMNAKSCGEHSVHRLSFRIFKGEIPQNKIVLHSCDNRLCCNPEHLSLGWHSDNAQDAFLKGRRNIEAVALLAEERRIPQNLVEEIARRTVNGEHYEEIAKSLNISRSTAHKYTRRYTHGQS